MKYGPRPLTKGLLFLICMMQDHGKFLNSQAICMSYHTPKLCGPRTWQVLERTFYDLPDKMLAKHGLAKNKVSFDAVMNFEVTKEMLVTNYNWLPRKFTFTV